MRLPRPINKVGRVKGQWAAHHARSRSVVAVRARGRCEGCTREEPLDWCHSMGRRHLIAEPFCSMPELTLGLCRACHRAIDGDLGGTNKTLREKLRWLAFDRLAQKTGYWSWIPASRSKYGSGLNAARALVAILEKEVMAGR